MEQKVLDFYFKNIDNEDVDAITCDEFGISEEELNYILMADFVDAHSF